MSNMDSSPRVRPVFDALLNRRPSGAPWLEGLWDMAASTRPGVAASHPQTLGALGADGAPSQGVDRVGTIYARAVAPPASFLRWLLVHPEAMEVRDRETFGAKHPVAREWRRRLLSADAAEISAAQVEGLRQLDSRLAQRGRHKWWLFEGFTRVDACFVTDTCVLFVQTLRADTMASSSRWFPTRLSVWRDVEAAQELAAGKAFGVILAVESDADGVAALAGADAALDGSFPHLDAEARAALGRHLLGFVTWAAIVSRFDLPATCLSETASASRRDRVSMRAAGGRL